MNNMKIQFNTVPQSPMIDTKTQLRFAVQNLTDSKNISDLHARVVLVTNSYGQVVTLKFENFSSNGVFRAYPKIRYDYSSMLLLLKYGLYPEEEGERG